MVHIMTHRQFSTIVSRSGVLILSSKYDDVEFKESDMHDPERKIECLKQIQIFNKDLELMSPKLTILRFDSDLSLQGGEKSSSEREKSVRTTQRSRRHDMIMIRDEMLKQTLKKAHQSEMKKRQPFTQRTTKSIQHKYSNYFYGDKAIRSLFVFNSPRFYFWTIEFAFFIMCLYMATMLTQILPIFVARADRIYVLTWTILLFLPIVLATFQVPGILKRAVILKAISRLDKRIMHDVVNEVIEEEGILDEVRGKIISLMDDDLDDPSKVKFIRQQFDEICGGRHRMYKKQCRDFLGKLKVYLTKEKFELLWVVLDNDLSGYVTCDEVLLFVFPEIGKSIQKDIQILEALQSTVAQNFHDQGVPHEEWENVLLDAFSQYDIDHSGDIDKEEFEQILKDLDVHGALKGEGLSFWVFTYGSAGENRLNEETYMKIMLPNKETHYHHHSFSNLVRLSLRAENVECRNSEFISDDTKQDDELSCASSNLISDGSSSLRSAPLYDWHHIDWSNHKKSRDTLIDIENEMAAENDTSSSLSSSLKRFIFGDKIENSISSADCTVDKSFVDVSP
jgi:hypothetical protein